MLLDLDAADRQTATTGQVTEAEVGAHTQLHERSLAVRKFQMHAEWAGARHMGSGKPAALRLDFHGEPVVRWNRMCLQK